MGHNFISMLLFLQMQVFKNLVQRDRNGMKFVLTIPFISLNLFQDIFNYYTVSDLGYKVIFNILSCANSMKFCPKRISKTL